MRSKLIKISFTTLAILGLVFLVFPSGYSADTFASETQWAPFLSTEGEGASPTQESFNPDAIGLLIQDYNPWSGKNTHNALDELNIPHDVINSSHLAAWDLDKYQFILYASAQDNNYYQNLKNNLPKISNFVSNGGLLIAHSCDGGWDGVGDWRGFSILPGGVTHLMQWDEGKYLSQSVHIVEPEHQIVKSDEFTLTDDYFNGWGYVTHGIFTNFLDNSNIKNPKIVMESDEEDGGDGPTYIDYDYGAGKVLATMQTVEWGYFNGSQGWAGNRPELLRNEIRFAKKWEKKWSFAIITDLHIGRGYPDYDSSGYEDNGEGEDYYLTERLQKVVNWINENKNKIDCNGTKCPIRFLAVLGDIADTAEKSEFLKAKNILDKLNDPNGDGNTSDGIPYVPVFGNHDVWPYTDFEEANYSQGEEFFDEIFWNENATNTKLIQERFNNSFKRDEIHKNYKNFAFSYKEMNFIGLDFVTRNPVPFDKGVGSDAVLGWENKSWLELRLEEFKGKPVIIFSHHPFAESSITAFESKEIDKIKEIIKDGKILANFGGHIHGAYPFLLPHLVEYFMDANKEYDLINGTHILTTEALMVGSNEDDEYLKEHDKGIIKIVKVLEENKIDYKTNEGRYKPETNEGKEFVALNPYVSFDYKIFPEQIYPCIFLKAHTFTHRENNLIWEINSENIGSGLIATHCGLNPGVYTIKLRAIDKETGEEEFITRKVEIKEGIIPKIIKIAEELKEKVELISTELGEEVTEFGRTMRDWVLVKVKHSPSTPVGLIDVHFEKATDDIDLTQMVVDTNVEKKKSILYMLGWPEMIEQQKILFISK